jgi:hypothetical protein
MKTFVVSNLASTIAPVAKPSPLYITVTTATGLAISSTTGSSEITHRYCQPCAVTGDDALRQAVTQALVMIDQYRLRRLLVLHRSYLRDVEDATPEQLGLVQLPVEIRTSSEQLVEAETYLRDEPKDSKDSPPQISEFRKQLLRFNVGWTRLYAHDAPELGALRKWATLNFQPGRSASHNGPTRDDCSRILASFKLLEVEQP